MARHELLEITDDKWSDDVWSTTTSGSSKTDNPTLYFYFGENDHWVDNATRDAIIAARARTSEPGSEGKAVMEIDTKGIPHDFCISM